MIDPFTFNKANKEQQEQREETQVLDVPLITVNKLVFRSQLEKETYKPVELLSYTEIISHLKRESFRREKGDEQHKVKSPIQVSSRSMPYLKLSQSNMGKSKVLLNIGINNHQFVLNN